MLAKSDINWILSYKRSPCKFPSTCCLHMAPSVWQQYQSALHGHLPKIPLQCVLQVMSQEWTWNQGQVLLFSTHLSPMLSIIHCSHTFKEQISIIHPRHKSTLALSCLETIKGIEKIFFLILRINIWYPRPSGRRYQKVFLNPENHGEGLKHSSTETSTDWLGGQQWWQKTHKDMLPHWTLTLPCPPKRASREVYLKSTVLGWQGHRFSRTCFLSPKTCLQRSEERRA